MKDKPNYFDQIDDFLLEELNEQEAVAFRQAVESDENLAKAVADQQRLLKGLTVGGRRKLKKDLKAIHQKVIGAQGSETPVRKMNWQLTVAAAAILLLGIVAWWVWTIPATSPTQIFADNYKPFELALSLRDTEVSDRKESLEKVIQQYREEEYQEAIPLLESLLEEKNNAQLQIALAIARFKTGEKTTAFIPLEKIIASDDPFLADEAKWYQALFYLQLNQVDQALPFLESLANTPDADHQKEAQEILQLIQ